MNRILFEKSEIREDGSAVFGGERALHVVNVLHGERGQTLKTGVLDGKIGTSIITDIGGTTSEPVVTVKTDHGEESLAPWVDLVLAPPRPRVLKRLLPQLATMGARRIFLVGAKKVEKDFWGATLLKPEIYRPLLVDGLMQGGTSIVPVIETRRNFRRFVTDELDSLFPDTRRIVAHPYSSPSGENTLSALSTKHYALSTTLAIGPEGGWTDEEVELLEAHGFTRFSLGSRILRTDTATIALLAVLGAGA